MLLLHYWTMYGIKVTAEAGCTYDDYFKFMWLAWTAELIKTLFFSISSIVILNTITRYVRCCVLFTFC